MLLTSPQCSHVTVPSGRTSVWFSRPHLRQFQILDSLLMGTRFLAEGRRRAQTEGQASFVGGIGETESITRRQTVPAGAENGEALPFLDECRPEAVKGAAVSSKNVEWLTHLENASRARRCGFLRTGSSRGSLCLPPRRLSSRIEARPGWRASHSPTPGR